MPEQRVEQSLFYNLHDLARFMRQYINIQASSVGLSLAQVRSINNIALEPGLKQHELAERMEISPVSVVRIVNSLVDAGIVSRRKDPRDGRVFRLHLTPLGKRHQKRVASIWDLTMSRAAEGLSSEHLHVVNYCLNHMKNNINEAKQELYKD